MKIYEDNLYFIKKYALWYSNSLKFKSIRFKINIEHRGKFQFGF